MLQSNKLFLITDTHGEDIVLPFGTQTFIHLGDCEQSNIYYPHTPVISILVKGNHDNSTVDPFDIVCDSIVIDTLLFTHEPVERLPKGAHYNVHGHLHADKYEEYGFKKNEFHIRLEPNILYVATYKLERWSIEKYG